MAKKKEIQSFEYEGKKITFDFGDGNKMVNATEMVKAFEGKRLDNFMRLKSTKEFIEILKSDPSHVREREIVKVVKGGTPELQGTWMNDLLALDLAAWLSPKFKLWMYQRIKELLTTGKANLDPYYPTDDELLFYLKKIMYNSQESMQLSNQLRQRLKGEFELPEE